MKFYFNPLAEAEFENAIQYYEDCKTGLGLEFAEEVYSTIKRICEYPAASVPLSMNSRRCLVNRFPYGVIYQAKPDVIIVVAVANLHKEPGYWLART